MNVLLIGMPGAGKSTLSKPLARRLRKKHVEIDELIEENIHMDLQSYIDTFGNESFQQKERQIIMSILKTCNNCVISPPGSLIYYDEIREYIRKYTSQFVVIYLHCHLPAILARTNHFENRGVVFDTTVVNPYEFVYRERLPLYDYWAQYIVNATRPQSELLRAMGTLVKSLKS